MSKSDQETFAHRVERLEKLIEALDERIDAVVGRLEWMQIQAAQPHSQPRDAAAWAPELHSGRWHARDGTVYGRYTYEAGAAGQQLDPQLRRSPPATE